MHITLTFLGSSLVGLCKRRLHSSISWIVSKAVSFSFTWVVNIILLFQVRKRYCIDYIWCIYSWTTVFYPWFRRGLSFISIELFVVGTFALEGDGVMGCFTFLIFFFDDIQHNNFFDNIIFSFHFIQDGKMFYGFYSNTQWQNTYCLQMYQIWRQWSLILQLTWKCLVPLLPWASNLLLLIGTDPSMILNFRASFMPKETRIQLMPQFFPWWISKRLLQVSVLVALLVKVQLDTFTRLSMLMERYALATYVG